LSIKNFQIKNGLSVNGQEVIDGNANGDFTSVIISGIDILEYTQEAYNQANTVNNTANTAQSAFNTANGANGLAAGAFNQANTTAGGLLTANSNISIIQGVDLTQNTNITSVNQFAQAAFDKANTGGTFTANSTFQQNLSANSYSIAGSAYINSNRTITQYGTTHNVLGSGSGNRTIDISLGNFVSATVTGPTTWTFTNPLVAPSATGFVLELTDGGSATQTWPSVKWPGGTAPTLTLSGIDVLTFITDDGGTTWRGVASMLDSK